MLEDDNDTEDGRPNVIKAWGDVIEAREGLSVHSEGGGEEAFIYTRADGRSGHVALGDEELFVDSSLAGRPSQGEADTLDVCKKLVSAWRSGGETWSDVEDVSSGRARDEDGVDCRTRLDGEIAQIQVTRALEDKARWKELACAGQLKERFSVEGAALMLRKAVSKKAGKLGGVGPDDIVLALDATAYSALALQRVVERFREVHGEWLRSIGFHSVWVVGASQKMIHRLDE